jgi:hypothetical protein
MTTWPDATGAFTVFGNQSGSQVQASNAQQLAQINRLSGYATVNLGTVGGTATCDFATNDCVILTETANTPLTLTLTAPTQDGKECVLIVAMPSSGTTAANTLLTFPAAVINTSFAAPAQYLPTATNSVTTIYTFVFIQGLYILLKVDVSGATDTFKQPVPLGILQNASISVSFLQVTANQLRTALFDSGTFGSTGTVNWAGSDFRKFTLTTATNCTVSFTAPSGSAPARLRLLVIAPASGTSPTITWPGTVKQGTPAIPTTVTLAKTSLLDFMFDGTSYWFLGAQQNQ